MAELVINKAVPLEGTRIVVSFWKITNVSFTANTGKLNIAMGGYDSDTSTKPLLTKVISIDVSRGGMTQEELGTFIGTISQVILRDAFFSGDAQSGK